MGKQDLLEKKFKAQMSVLEHEYHSKLAMVKRSSGEIAFSKTVTYSVMNEDNDCIALQTFLKDCGTAINSQDMCKSSFVTGNQAFYDHKVDVIPNADNLNMNPSCKDKKVYAITIEDKNRTSLPDSIGNFPNLRSLIAIYTPLASLPTTVKNLTSLRYLCV